ncbi:MAG: hypothetical protein ACFE8L_04805 [Candidatus Hodarchaeota archaeon]
MILQNNDFSRILTIYITQLIFCGVLLFIAYKVLKRNRNRLTLTLSGFYFSVSIGLFLNAVYPPLDNKDLVTIIYIIAAYFVLLSPIFLVLFNINLLQAGKENFLRKWAVYIILYTLSLIFCLNIPGGITILEEPNFRPLFAWEFLIVLYIFISLFIVFPLIITSLKLYKTFKDPMLKRKLGFFFIGSFGLITSLCIMVLYNTFRDPIIRSILSIIGSFIMLLSAGLIYYAWVQRL